VLFGEGSPAVRSLWLALAIGTSALGRTTKNGSWPEAVRVEEPPEFGWRLWPAARSERLSNRVISGSQPARLTATSATPMAFGAKHKPVSLSGENMPTTLVRDSRIDVTLAGAGKQMLKVSDTRLTRSGVAPIWRTARAEANQPTIIAADNHHAAGPLVRPPCGRPTCQPAAISRIQRDRLAAVATSGEQVRRLMMAGAAP
jgi:hypothetical protein